MVHRNGGLAEHRIVIASHKCPRHRDHREKRSSPPSLNLLPPPPPPPPPLMEAEQFRRDILGKDAEKRWISTTPQTDRPIHTILARIHCVVTSPRCRKENSFCWEFCFIYTALFRGPFFIYGFVCSRFECWLKVRKSFQQ